MRFDPHHEVQIPRRRVTVASASLPGQPDSLAVQDAGWNVDVILPSVQSESAFSALIGLFQSQFQFGLLIGAGNRSEPTASAEHLPEEVFEVDGTLTTATVAALHPHPPTAVPARVCPPPFVLIPHST